MLSRQLNNLRKTSVIRSYNTNGMTYKSSKVIRREFLDYFIKELKHKYVPSSPVMPMNDPTIPFVNAGMNQVCLLLRISVAISLNFTLNFKVLLF